jgi:hypothetical protein
VKIKEDIDRPMLVSFAFMLGYTDNVYFPRGLVRFTEGVFLPDFNNKYRIFNTSDTEITHNIQSASGTSGAGVFENIDTLVGMHLKATRYSLITAATTNSVAVFDTTPSIGVSISAVLRDLKSKCNSVQFREIELNVKEIVLEVESPCN